MGVKFHKFYSCADFQILGWVFFLKVKMGSSSSKGNAADSSSTSSDVRRTRSYRSRVFQSSCLRSHHDYSGNAAHQVSEHHTEEDADHGSSETKSISGEGVDEGDKKLKEQQSDDTNSEASESEADDEWDQKRGGCMSSRAFSSRALNASSSFLSRLNIFHGNASFRLQRTNSLGSMRPYFESSTRFGVTSTGHGQSPPESTGNGNLQTQSDDLFNTFFANQVSRVQPENASADIVRQMISNRGVVDNGVDVGVDSCENSDSRSQAYADIAEERFANRRIAAGETVGRNVHFSRTLSVGRLRDRVLRRSNFTDEASSSFHQERGVRNTSRASERQVLDSGMSLTSSGVNTYLSGPGSLMYGSQYRELDASRPREATYHDLLEYRSNFLERRRRIRSQVRALQRLGSRFENITGHERTCILSQHRRGHCTCRNNSRNTDSSDESTARASISRIVMLAEALFEVLDEIHQQSVVLSSRPSMSSIGSIPAPIEVVDSLPLRSHSKSRKQLHDDVAQCYICLIEYEGGDSLRTLPCHHEYHKTCIDKWLKEIHRVCPLCRRDVCQTDSFPTDV